MSKRPENLPPSKTISDVSATRSCFETSSLRYGPTTSSRIRPTSPFVILLKKTTTFRYVYKLIGNPTLRSRYVAARCAAHVCGSAGTARPAQGGRRCTRPSGARTTPRMSSSPPPSKGGFGTRRALQSPLPSLWCRRHSRE